MHLKQGPSSPHFEYFAIVHPLILPHFEYLAVVLVSECSPGKFLLPSANVHFLAIQKKLLLGPIKQLVFVGDRKRTYTIPASYAPSKVGEPHSILILLQRNG